MKIINARSPYFIEVTGSSTTSVQLYIWNGQTEPASPQYTFTKPAPSVTQTTSNYNISPYIEEYIANVYPLYNATPASEGNQSFCQFKVIKFSNGVNRTLAFKTRVLADSGTFEADNCVGTLMEDFIMGVGVDGYNKYSDGYNKITNSDVYPLTSQAISYNYEEGTDKTYLNLLINHTGSTITSEYVHQNTTYTYTIVSNTTASGVYNMKIPYKLNGFTSSNILRIKNNGTLLYTFNVSPKCEPKYTPVLCSFTNRYGGWSFLTFYKAKSESISITSEQYKILSPTVNYDIYKGQYQNININGQKSVTLNTGFVEENYNELIEDLLLSKKILMDNVPVNIKTTATDLKTALRDKNINYTIEFVYSSDMINNVI